MGRCKDRERAGSRSVGTRFTISEDVSNEVQVLVFFVLGEFEFDSRRRISVTDIEEDGFVEGVSDSVGCSEGDMEKNMTRQVDRVVERDF